jgi:hypothetical protein
VIRYHLMHASDSNIQMSRVRFSQDGPVCGMKAKSFISSGTYLLHSAANLALDAPWDFSEDAKPSLKPPPGLWLSVFNPPRWMVGPARSRICLGPLRFFNHSCKPNCEVSVRIFIPRTSLTFFGLGLGLGVGLGLGLGLG